MANLSAAPVSCRGVRPLPCRLVVGRDSYDIGPRSCLDKAGVEDAVRLRPYSQDQHNIGVTASLAAFGGSALQVVGVLCLATQPVGGVRMRHYPADPYLHHRRFAGNHHSTRPVRRGHC